MNNDRTQKRKKPLNTSQLKQLALHYVGRYATTRSKLASYLNRKVKERGWDDETDPDIRALVERFSELGYIDDKSFANDKAAALARKGYGARRVQQALFGAGISEEDGQEATEMAREQQWQAAHIYAKKKSIGPYAQDTVKPDKQQKQLQAFLRAGHQFDIAKRFVFAAPDDIIDEY